MLTRVEVDGFKSFDHFDLDLPPFVVILGPNAAGKSNLFDALRLLSHLATMDVRSAMRELRGEPHELFRATPGKKPADHISLAVEMLVPRTLNDYYNQTIELNCTRLRYEIKLCRKSIDGIERFFVVQERAVPIRRRSSDADRLGDRWQPLGKVISRPFKENFVVYTSRSTPYLETKLAEGQRTFAIHQDGKQGRARQLPAEAAMASALSTITVASEFVHLYAIREELRSLRYLQLDPAAERRSSPFDVNEMLERDGSNLAAVLYRIQQETQTDQQPRGRLTDIRNDLANLIPGILNIHVDRDDIRREYRLEVETRNGQRFSSRVASDGTLRVLALLALLNDPRHRGTLCFEEPENGVNPRRLTSLMHYLRDACAPVHENEIEKDDPQVLQQIIINTHSPIAAGAVKDQIVVADTAMILRDGQVERATRMRPYKISGQSSLPLGDGPRPVTHAEIEGMFKLIEQDELAA